MRIVVFNSPMIYLSGGQVNARDWALGLKARGLHGVEFVVADDHAGLPG